MSFGKQLRTLRRKHRLKQHEVAALVHVDRSTIAHLEADRQAPSWALATSLATALDAKLDDFRCPELFAGDEHG